MNKRVVWFSGNENKVSEELLDEILRVLRNGKRVIALTGAGASHASGIPTFRGKDGLYQGHDPMDLASPQGFRKNPKLVWEWYKYRISLINNAVPNPIHLFLATLEQKGLLDAVITQNVDDLHERAGSRNVIHLHGEIMKYRCTSCSYQGLWENSDFDVPPRCPKCNALLRPSVVWFGESLPPQALEESMKYAQSSDICLVIGTSGLVYPAASLPLITKRHEGLVIEFNIQESELSAIADYLFLGPSEFLMNELLRKLRDE